MQQGHWCSANKCAILFLFYIHKHEVDIDAFLKALRELKHVPEQVIEQAIGNADAILPEDREELLEKLQEVEGQAKEFHEEEDAALKDMEKLVADAEHAFDRIERQEEEQQERKQESASAEELLSDTQAT